MNGFIVVMKIKASLYLFYVPRDRDGNVYWGFRYIDHETGYRASGQAPSESNMSAAMYELGHKDGSEYLRCNIPISKKEYKRSFYRYVGCGPKEIANSIRGQLAAKNMIVD